MNNSGWIVVDYGINIDILSGKRLHSYWKLPFIGDLPIEDGNC